MKEAEGDSSPPNSKELWTVQSPSPTLDRPSSANTLGLRKPFSAVRSSDQLSLRDNHKAQRLLHSSPTLFEVLFRSRKSSARACDTDRAQPNPHTHTSLQPPPLPSVPPSSNTDSSSSQRDQAEPDREGRQNFLSSAAKILGDSSHLDCRKASRSVDSSISRLKHHISSSNPFSQAQHLLEALHDSRQLFDSANFNPSSLFPCKPSPRQWERRSSALAQRPSPIVIRRPLSGLSKRDKFAGGDQDVPEPSLSHMSSSIWEHEVILKGVIDPSDDLFPKYRPKGVARGSPEDPNSRPQGSSSQYRALSPSKIDREPILPTSPLALVRAAGPNASLSRHTYRLSPHAMAPRTPREDNGENHFDQVDAWTNPHRELFVRQSNTPTQMPISSPPPLPNSSLELAGGIDSSPEYHLPSNEAEGIFMGRGNSANGVNDLTEDLTQYEDMPEGLKVDDLPTGMDINTEFGESGKAANNHKHLVTPSSLEGNVSSPALEFLPSTTYSPNHVRNGQAIRRAANQRRNDYPDQPKFTFPRGTPSEILNTVPGNLPEGPLPLLPSSPGPSNERGSNGNPDTSLEDSSPRASNEDDDEWGGTDAAFAKLIGYQSLEEYRREMSEERRGLDTFPAQKLAENENSENLEKGDNVAAEPTGRSEDRDWETVADSHSLSGQGTQSQSAQGVTGNSIADYSDSSVGPPKVEQATSRGQGQVIQHPGHPRYAHSYNAMRNEITGELQIMPEYQFAGGSGFPHQNATTRLTTNVGTGNRYQHPTPLSREHAHPFQSEPPSVNSRTDWPITYTAVHPLVGEVSGQSDLLGLRRLDTIETHQTLRGTDEYEMSDLSRMVDDGSDRVRNLTAPAQNQASKVPSPSTRLGPVSQGASERRGELTRSANSFAMKLITGRIANITGTPSGTGAREVGSSLAGGSSREHQLSSSVNTTSTPFGRLPFHDTSSSSEPSLPHSTDQSVKSHQTVDQAMPKQSRRQRKRQRKMKRAVPVGVPVGVPAEWAVMYGEEWQNLHGDEEETTVAIPTRSTVRSSELRKRQARTENNLIAKGSQASEAAAASTTDIGLDASSMGLRRRPFVQSSNPSTEMGIEMGVSRVPASPTASTTPLVRRDPNSTEVIEGKKLIAKLKKKHADTSLTSSPIPRSFEEVRRHIDSKFQLPGSSPDNSPASTTFARDDIPTYPMFELPGGINLLWPRPTIRGHWPLPRGDPPHMFRYHRISYKEFLIRQRRVSVAVFAISCCLLCLPLIPYAGGYLDFLAPWLTGNVVHRFGQKEKTAALYVGFIGTPLWIAAILLIAFKAYL